ncbi:hypothetical protein INR49_014572 [Caranx melampygus]|nr:hypothetical protein INR49_014572 [Caranx melampygus]
MVTSGQVPSTSRDKCSAMCPSEGLGSVLTLGYLMSLFRMRSERSVHSLPETESTPAGWMAQDLQQQLSEYSPKTKRTRTHRREGSLSRRESECVCVSEAV